MSCCCCLSVQTSEIAVIERFGKYSRLEEAGCSVICIPCEYVQGRVSLRVQEIGVQCETKTKDNVFVVVNASIQYQTVREKIYNSFYSLSDPQSQMRAYVYDVIRATLPTMTLDQAFESKDEISLSLKRHLEEVMNHYGFTILQALVTEMSPDERVRNAMNEINASKRLKEAAYQRAEGEKVVKVKIAEAEAEAMYLSGIGISRQRKAIMDGFRDNLVQFSSEVKDSTPKEIMDLLVLNQYFDVLQNVGQSANTRCVFLSNDHQETRSGVLQANAARGFSST